MYVLSFPCQQLADSVGRWKAASFMGSASYLSGGAIYADNNTSLSFNGTSNFVNNSAYQGGAIFAAFNTSLSFTGTSNFINNSADICAGGAIYLYINTSLSLNGTGNFINNSAHIGWGGGMFLSNSTLSILSNTTGYWESNQALYGGAIYVEDLQYTKPQLYCTQLYTNTTKDDCFFQLPVQNLSNDIDAQFIFKDNSADAGSVLYGGAIDNCKLTGLESYSSGEVFDNLIKSENGNTNPNVSSDPFHICSCANNRPNCSKSGKSYKVYPGETFYVSVVAVGQRNGKAPTKVIGRLTCDGIWSHTTHIGNLQPFQYAQLTSNTCTTLSYTVFARFNLHLELHTDGPCSTFSNELDLKLDVNLTCPPGFNLSVIKKSCL